MSTLASSFEKVPVVDVHRNNFHSFWPSILFACKDASFIAVDVELSGLGPRKNLVVKDLNERYKLVCDVAKTRAVLSLGISCFKYKPSTRKESKFAVQTYNITTLCDQDYMVEPAALQFLVEHGFDFNKQYSQGILYHTGPDKGSETDDISIRSLFGEILMSCKPVVVHNGFIDMAFLYQHFYTNLPPSFSQFLVDLSEMYKGGLFDTKYLAEFTARMPSSYLEYVFRKCLRDNSNHTACEERHITLTFQEYPDGSRFVEYHPCTLPETNRGIQTEHKKKICHLYSAFGFCKKSNCEDSHDLDVILDADQTRTEQKKKRRRRKRKMKTEEGQLEEESKENEPSPSPVLESDSQTDAAEADEPPRKLGKAENGPAVSMSNDGGLASGKANENSSVSPTQHGSHRAGFDAFMTGFALACIINEQGKFPSEGEEEEGRQLEGFGMSGEANKLALTGKNIPMLIMKSSYAKSSQAHREKMERLSSSEGR